MSRPSLGSTSKIVARFFNLDAAQLVQCFVPAEEKHLPQVVAIRQAFVQRSAEADADYLRWRYCWAPRSSFASRWADNRIWAFVNGDKVLGFVGVEVVELNIDGEVRRCLKVMDIAVLPELDGKGLGVWMNLVVLDSGLPVLCLGSNRNSLGLIERLFHRMPDRKVYKSILRSRDYFSSRLGNAWPAHLTVRGYDGAMAAWLGLKSARLKNPWRSGALSLKAVAAFNKDHEAAPPAPIFIRRPKEYLNWRLLDIPERSPQVFEVLNRGESVGFLAYTTHPDRRDALLQDWAIKTADPKRWQALLAGALVLLQRRLFTLGYSSLTVLGYDEASGAAFRRAGIRQRDDNSKTFSLWCAEPTVLERLSRPEQWFISGSDADDF